MYILFLHSHQRPSLYNGHNFLANRVALLERDYCTIITSPPTPPPQHPPNPTPTPNRQQSDTLCHRPLVKGTAFAQMIHSQDSLASVLLLVRASIKRATTDYRYITCCALPFCYSVCCISITAVPYRVTAAQFWDLPHKQSHGLMHRDLLITYFIFSTQCRN